jgi:hypothetical protein
MKKRALGKRPLFSYRRFAMGGDHPVQLRLVFRQVAKDLILKQHPFFAQFQQMFIRCWFHICFGGMYGPVGHVICIMQLFEMRIGAAEFLHLGDIFRKFRSKFMWRIRHLRSLNSGLCVLCPTPGEGQNTG